MKHLFFVWLFTSWAAFGQGFFQPGDTLVNLNILNRGVVKAQAGIDMDTNLFHLSGEGIITAKTSLDSLIGKQVFSVKTTSSETETYDNTITLSFQTTPALIQVHSDKIEMATGLKKDGKIWVVVAVSLILFLGLVGYLVVLDRKLK